MLGDSAGRPSDHDWAADLRIVEDCKRTGRSFSVDEGLAAFDRSLDEQLSKFVQPED